MSVTNSAMADDVSLLQKIDRLAAELEALKAELAVTRNKTEIVEKNKRR